MFKHRLVRDLAWVISSPPLISGSFNNTHWWNERNCQNEFTDCLLTLKSLDDNPKRLTEYLNNKNTKRLGHYFETLIAFWLTISPNYSLIAKNIQIIKNGHTYGEIDFIVLDQHTQKVIHLEVAVKFYLGTPEYNNPFRWFGTNTKDQLGKKANHLQTHQTQLSVKHKSHIQNLGYQIDEMQCILKGRLFYPINIALPPDGVTTNHLRGSWITKKEQCIETTDSLFYPLQKSEWLSELKENDINKSLIQACMTKNERATCYVEFNKEMVELNRAFYLPENFVFPE